ncbi:protein patched homolog 2-like [Penaeus japonicus]|uniref:protein patched homolog 2-like n=1 Tax=Penaeus japonicus TaxID=27405 RepID=UPI001C710DAA|nr:protein patched homolog 2-like [Penaeus japonicus]
MAGKDQRHCLGRVSSVVTGSLERFFYRHGKSVASYPFRYIVSCLAITALCCVGFLNFKMEHRPEKLWIPQDSDYVTTLSWRDENFPSVQRIEMLLFEASNVLKAEYVKEMFLLHQDIRKIVVINDQGQNVTQEDLCFRVPALGGEMRQELRQIKASMFPGRNPNNDFDWSLEFDKTIYYQFYSRMPSECLELSILEMWGYDEEVIGALSDEDVILAINTVNISSTYSHPVDFRKFLGGIERNASGHITGAKTSLTQILMHVNRSEIDLSDSNNAGLAEEVNPSLFAWEGEFIRLLRNPVRRPQGLGIFFQSHRSFGEVSSETVFGDVTFLIFGNAMLFIYVQIMLGKFNMVEKRPVLSLLGLLATYLAVGISFGLCSAVGLPYSPVHSILPLLMLGLGVDDMFVIVQSWHNLKPQERKLNLQTKIGRALRHAGVAITVTSLTDFAAFAIGATTVLPALRSFCLYSALGIVALYLLQATFFVAWFTLDQSRLEDHRDGLIWCYKHKNWTPNKCSTHDYCQMFLDKIYGKFLLKKPVKVAVILATIAMTGASVWGVTNLRQEFDPVLFIPQSSYLFKFLSRILHYYPEAGERGTLYLGALNYSQELPKIGELTTQMKENEYISFVDSWYDLMVTYTMQDVGIDIGGKVMNETFFREILSAFLFSPSGSRFQTFFHFNGNLTIGKPTPQLLACKFDYSHRTLSGSAEKIVALDQLNGLINNQNFSDFAGAIAFNYAGWETDKIIATELIRNVSLAMVAVFIMTLLLLANFVTSFYVLLCVSLTLVDVMALMAWWDLTIDIISCINLVLCIGLCVDYSAHIGLHFMQVSGTRNERAHKTLREMGPPVINGAFSTFLSFSLLVFSDSHVFQSFFKIFFGTCLFGVFHGLTFLPVLLSLIGPAPYNDTLISMSQVDEVDDKTEAPIKRSVEMNKVEETTYAVITGD